MAPLIYSPYTSTALDDLTLQPMQRRVIVFYDRRRTTNPFVVLEKRRDFNERIHMDELHHMPDEQSAVRAAELYLQSRKAKDVLVLYTKESTPQSDLTTNRLLEASIGIRVSNLLLLCQHQVKTNDLRQEFYARQNRSIAALHYKGPREMWEEGVEWASKQPATHVYRMARLRLEFTSSLVNDIEMLALDSHYHNYFEFFEPVASE